MESRDFDSFTGSKNIGLAKSCPQFTLKIETTTDICKGERRWAFLNSTGSSPVACTRTLCAVFRPQTI